jgi:hypothetical protein
MGEEIRMLGDCYGTMKIMQLSPNYPHLHPKLCVMACARESRSSVNTTTKPRHAPGAAFRIASCLTLGPLFVK